MKTSTLKLTDDKIIKEYLKGDNNALGILYNRYYKKVYYKCLTYTKNNDDAFDYAQEILMKAFSNIHSFKGNSMFSSWLYAITQNYCISQMTKANRLKYEDINNKTYHFIENSDDLEVRQNREDMELEVFQFLNDIPEIDKKILELKYKYNYSIKELQLTFDLSASAVKMRLMRARQKVSDIYNRKTIS